MREFAINAIIVVPIRPDQAFTHIDAITTIRQLEVLGAKRMIERSLGTFDFYPSQLLGDSG